MECRETKCQEEKLSCTNKPWLTGFAPLYGINAFTRVRFQIIISLSNWLIEFPNIYLFIYFLKMFVYFWERERQSMSKGEAKRGRHRIWSKLQALSRPPLRARTHEPRDHDLSRSQMFNRLSPPGTPRIPEHLKIDLCELVGLLFDPELHTGANEQPGFWSDLGNAWPLVKRYF